MLNNRSCFYVIYESPSPHYVYNDNAHSSLLSDRDMFYTLLHSLKDSILPTIDFYRWMKLRRIDELE